MFNLDVIRQRLFHIQLVFAACAVCVFVILGIQTAFSIPPFQIPDESRHWITAVTRANNLTSLWEKRSKNPECSVEFGLISKMAQNSLVFQRGNRMPTNTFGSLKETQKACESVIVSYGNVLTYPGTLVSKLFLEGESRGAFSALVGFYASRIIHGLLVFALLARLLVLAYRAQSVPIGLVLISALATSPLFVQQSFAVSSDPICFMFVFSLLGVVLFPSLVNRIDVVVAVILALTASHTKPPMAVFGMSAAALGFFRCSTRRYRIWLLSIVLASILGAGFIGLSFGASAPASPDFRQGVSIGQQLAFVMANPITSFQALNNVTWLVFGIDQLAHPLGWLDTYLPQRVLSSWYTILWLALGLEIGGLLQVRWALGSPLKACKALAQSAIFLSGMYVATLATPLILYLSWTPVGAPGVDGMQSRYLFPSLFLVLAGLSSVCRVDRPSEELPRKRYPIEFFVVVTVMAIVSALYVSELHIGIAARYW